jgi:hypothetical protein
MEQTTPWYFTGCAGFSSRMWQAPKLPLLQTQSSQQKQRCQATVITQTIKLIEFSATLS